MFPLFTWYNLDFMNPHATNSSLVTDAPTFLGISYQSICEGKSDWCVSPINQGQMKWCLILLEHKSIRNTTTFKLWQQSTWNEMLINLLEYNRIHNTIRSQLWLQEVLQRVEIHITSKCLHGKLEGPIDLRPRECHLHIDFGFHSMT